MNLNSAIVNLQPNLPEFLEILFQENAKLIRVGASYRINPCPYCGHNDCLTVNSNNLLYHCFSCRSGGNLFQLVSHVMGNAALAIGRIESFLDIKIEFEKIDEAALRLNSIRGYAAKFYHRELLDDQKYLDYLIFTRMHTLDSIEQFQIGKAFNYTELYKSLIAAGYSQDEIQKAKVFVPDNLMVFPYQDQHGFIIRFNTKNPFHVENSYGKHDVIKGYCTSEKTNYRSPGFTNDTVIVCEGEHDKISLHEAGAQVDIIAFGGNPNQEQIDELRNYEKLFCMFDNDGAGRKYLEAVNKALPDKKVYEVIYDRNYKDPDEYYKKNPQPTPITTLLEQAVPLENSNYIITIIDHTLELKNREYLLTYRITDIERNGRLKGDFIYKIGGKTPDDIKFGVTIDRIGKKYSHFINPMQEALENYYNGSMSDKDITELLDIYKFSFQKDKIVKEFARILVDYNDCTRKNSLKQIEDRCGRRILDSVLREINAFENQALDPDINYPYMTASQAFDMNRLIAYMYYNSSELDNDGIRIIPTLLTSNKRTLRLDLYRRKSEQHMLIVDQGFQLHYEVSTAIMSTDTCSLKSKYAKMYIDGSFTEDDLRPRVIIQEMEQYIREVFYTDDKSLYKIIALFAFSTYAYQLFGVTGYLFLNAQKGSGKSLLASVLSKICFCCRYTVGATEAALFRTISNCGGTIILDEMENLTNRDKTADSLMASILKSGYSKGSGNTLRTNLETKSVEEYSVYGPKILCNIFGLEDVLLDRCVSIPMKKYSAEVIGKMMNFTVFENKYHEQIQSTTSRACLSVLTNFKDIYDKYLSLDLNMGSARNSQIMRPLVALAVIAGEDYEEAINHYYQTYMLRDKDWTEKNSPEGYLKQAISILKEEDSLNLVNWLDSDTIKHFIDHDKSYSTLYTNTFVVKLLLDQIDGQKEYAMPEVLKLIKRVYPNIMFGNRTSISIASNENWVKLMRNKTKVAVYPLRISSSNEDCLNGVDDSSDDDPEIF